MRDNDYLMRTGEIAVVTFGLGNVRVIDPTGRTTDQIDQPFAPLHQFQPQALQAGGATPMVEGIQQAFSTVQARKNQLRKASLVLAHRPLVFMITDGQPTNDRGQITDAWRDFVSVIRDMENNKHLLFFPFGVDGADENVLRTLAPKGYKMLRDVDFNAAMTLVSASIEALTRVGRSGDETADDLHDRLNESLSKQDRIMDFLKGTG
jgi:uncharacterized protein YegL